MPIPPIINLEIIQTNTKTWKFKVTKKCGETRVPINLSGRTLFFTVKENPTCPDSSAVIKKTVEVPYNSDSENGIMYLCLTSADTSVPYGEYYFDFKLQRESSGGIIIDRKTLLTGQFIVNVSETQRTS